MRETKKGVHVTRIGKQKLLSSLNLRNFLHFGDSVADLS